ncbi:MAG: SsrA-binding protein SmpB [Spirochaetia bacterium]|nr:SsrA-binding protein SmpB [Spirochaetia bacterium]
MQLVENKKARFNYEIIDTLEAGIVLQGTELKSIRKKKINITDSYAAFKKNELFLINAKIEHYDKANIFNHEITRPRKLLLHKREIEKLKVKLKERGLSLFPIKMYFNDRQKVKVLLGLGKGKKKFDKRQTLKERDTKREMDRDLKQYSR